ncbi:MAG TPA: MoaD/ThiS family protein [Thermoanaerobaculia bacterium]|nr:MoaD/ThiS family protein [Thermoanaerobaculia bacterium]
MSVTLHIPTPLRRFTGEQGEIQIAGATVAEALRDLVRQHPALERHLFTPEGTLRSFVNVFKNEEDVRFLDKGETPIADGDVLSIIPSIAGGFR